MSTTRYRRQMPVNPMMVYVGIISLIGGVTLLTAEAEFIRSLVGGLCIGAGGHAVVTEVML